MQPASDTIGKAGISAKALSGALAFRVQNKLEIRRQNINHILMTNLGGKQTGIGKGGLSRDQLITLDDLAEFKLQLLYEIKNLFKEHHSQPLKKWIKSREVRKLLNISAGTLQTLRIGGKLPFTRLGGTILYDADNIQTILTASKTSQIRNAFNSSKRL